MTGLQLIKYFMYVYIKTPFMAIKDAVNSETILCMVNYTLYCEEMKYILQYW